jgi:hypothetical protein
MLGLDKHHSRTNIAVGQTSQSDNNTVRQMSQSNKFHSRTNVTVRQKLWSDKCRCRTNVAVGQTSLSDKCHGQTSRYLIFKVLVNNKKATKLQKVFFQQYHHLDFPWSVFVYLIIQRECVEDEWDAQQWQQSTHGSNPSQKIRRKTKCFENHFQLVF